LVLATAFVETDPAGPWASSCQLRSGVSPVPKSDGSFDFAQDGCRGCGFWGVEIEATCQPSPKLRPRSATILTQRPLIAKNAMNGAQLLRLCNSHDRATCQRPLIAKNAMNRAQLLRALPYPWLGHLPTPAHRKERDERGTASAGSAIPMAGPPANARSSQRTR